MTTTRQPESNEPYAGQVLTGTSPAVVRLRVQVARIAPHFRLALITGESGVGKIAIAREMHRLSPGGAGPLRSMASLDFVEMPQLRGGAGTLLIRDLSALRQDLQEAALTRLKLLSRETRVVVTSEPNARLLGSTAKARPEMHPELGILELWIPPLRERMEDLEILSRVMLRGLTAEASFAASSLSRMRTHDWAGNLQELWEFCSKVARARVSHGFAAIELRELPPFQSGNKRASEAIRLEDVIRRHVLDVVGRCAGNKLKAAEVLGISRSTLYRMLEAAPAEARRPNGGEVHGVEVVPALGVGAAESGLA